MSFPELRDPSLISTLACVHDYSRILGEWARACSSPRKHWWHICLRPTAAGFATPLLRANVDFDLELDLCKSRLVARVTGGGELCVPLAGQSAVELALQVQEFLVSEGVDQALVPDVEALVENSNDADGFSREAATLLCRAISAVSGVLERCRASVPEETSAVNLWPHHFDIALLWLSGEKVPGEDPENAEYSDKQVNFGFTFGDEGIAEPYFYLTYYPLDEELKNLALPAGAEWHTSGFTGVVVRYGDLQNMDKPEAYVFELWSNLVSAGRESLKANSH